MDSRIIVPGGGDAVAVVVEILSESDAARGWHYIVRVEREGGISEHRVHLAWVDHEHLCGGAVSPSRVVAEALRVAAERGIAIPPSVDVSTLRRREPGLRALLAWG
ncbi:MAG: hypothetical protein JNM80_08085 [Phycisphaerae bacterium]|nr:hypothetical protein [Phycisphaerae bacterium]